MLKISVQMDFVKYSGIELSPNETSFEHFTQFWTSLKRINKKL